MGTLKLFFGADPGSLAAPQLAAHQRAPARNTRRSTRRSAGRGAPRGGGSRSRSASATSASGSASGRRSCLTAPPSRLAEQVFGRRSQQRARARAVLGGDEAARAPRRSRPARASPSCAPGRQAAATASATASQVACSSSPSASVRPRQSSSGCHPGEPDRDVELPVAPGAAEAVGDHHGRRRRRQASAQRRARRRRGPPAAADARSGPPALETSTPALAQTRPWRVRADDHAALGAQNLLGLVEHDLHQRVRPCRRRLRAPARARPARTEASSTSAPSAFETAVWAIATTRPPAPAPRRGEGGCQDAGEVVAGARSRGSRGRARALQGGHRARLRPERRARRRRPGPAPRARRGCSARPPAVRRARLRSAARSSTVSTSSRASAAAPRGRRRRPHARARGGARSCRRRSSASIASGGASSRPFVPVPWRSGRIATSGARRGRARRSSGASSAGSSAGQSPGTQQHALEALRERPLARRARRPPTGRPRRGSSITQRARAPRRPASASGSRVTTTVSSIAVDRRQRREHVGDHRPGEREAQPVGDARAEALLGAAEALDGEDRGGAHGSGRSLDDRFRRSSLRAQRRVAAKSTVARASARAPGVVVHPRAGHERRQRPSGASSATIPSSSSP